MLKVYIQNNPLYYTIVKYTIDLVLSNKEQDYCFVETENLADIVICENNSSHFIISTKFYEKLNDHLYFHSHHLKDDYYIKNDENKRDLLASIFYLTNCVQEYEYPKNELDHYDRFPYEQSLQCKFDVIERNIVQEIIDEIFDKHPVLSKLKKEKKKSTVFLSHDIDFLIDPNWGEIKHALRNFKIVDVFKNTFHAFMKSPRHLDVETVYDIHHKSGFRSHYFWITNNQSKKSEIKNGDYLFANAKIQNLVARSESLKNFNQLHKSTNETTLDEEAKILGHHIEHNRYHYLKYTLPEAWKDLEKSKIKFDHSLAFGSKMGFRNSYGKPFKPYNFKTKEAHNFTVVPFQIMDSTFLHYEKDTPENILNKIQKFISANQFDTTLSIVWHNTSLCSPKNKAYLNLYKKILIHLKSLHINSETPTH